MLFVFVIMFLLRDFYKCYDIGLREYDPDARIARALEFKIGIKVIKHSE